MPTTKQARLELYPTPALKAAIEAKALSLGIETAAYCKAILAIAAGVDDPTVERLLRTIRGTRRKGAK